MRLGTPFSRAFTAHKQKKLNSKSPIALHCSYYPSISALCVMRHTAAPIACNDATQVTLSRLFVQQNQESTLQHFLVTDAYMQPALVAVIYNKNIHRRCCSVPALFPCFAHKLLVESTNAPLAELILYILCHDVISRSPKGIIFFPRISFFDESCWYYYHTSVTCCSLLEQCFESKRDWLAFVEFQ